MRTITMGITAVLSAGILMYSYHANLTGDQGKVGDRNPACATANTSTSPECQHDGKPGESK